MISSILQHPWTFVKESIFFFSHPNISFHAVLNASIDAINNSTAKVLGQLAFMAISPLIPTGLGKIAKTIPRISHSLSMAKFTKTARHTTARVIPLTLDVTGHLGMLQTGTNQISDFVNLKKKD